MTAPRRLVVATRNEHKLRELARDPRRRRALPLPDEVELPPETGETFAENALIKARAAREAPASAAIADDSGIAAAALGGRARRALGALRRRGRDRRGEPRAADRELERRERPLGRLRLRDRLRRRATATSRLFEGRCEGDAGREPRGSGGFGYDPAFVPDDDRRRRRAHDGRAERRPRSTRSATAAAPRALLAGALGSEPGAADDPHQDAAPPGSRSSRTRS